MKRFGRIPPLYEVCFIILLVMATSPLLAQIHSDDFHSTEFDSSKWIFVDPVGDGSFRMDGTHLIIDIPAGTEHHLWYDDSLVRLVQEVQDGDFEVEVKFDRQLLGQNALEGILVESDSNQILLLGFYSDLYNLRSFTALIDHGMPEKIYEQKILYSGLLYLRVRKTGSFWDYFYSVDGQNWKKGASFQTSIAVSRIGIYAGNTARNPANEVWVDYFFNREDPIIPEDGISAPPAFVPENVQASVISKSSIKLQWTYSGQDAEGFIIERKTNSRSEFKEIARTGAGPTEFIDKIGLVGKEYYTYRITAFNALGQSNVSEEVQVFNPGIKITLFYGDYQYFGRMGFAQSIINILGNVSDSHTIKGIFYSLNHKPFRTLLYGPDFRRLTYPGDFNLELPLDSLATGENYLSFLALDDSGDSVRKDLQFWIEPNPTVPETWEINWNTVHNIQNVAQVIDGHWQIKDGYLRPVAIGYDRLLAIGDSLWEDYEISTSILIHSFDENIAAGGGPGVGIIAHWQGFKGDQMPKRNASFGILAWYRKDDSDSLGYRWRLQASNDPVIENDPAGMRMVMDFPYNVKLRAMAISEDTTEYSLKVWRYSDPEPPQWMLATKKRGNLSGGALLVAHKTDVSFGSVVIKQLKKTVSGIANQERTDVFVPQSISVIPFPNPAKTYIRFRTNRPVEGTAVLRIYNALGQLVLEKRFYSLEESRQLFRVSFSEFQTKYFSNGVFFFQLIGKNFLYRDSFLILK